MVLSGAAAGAAGALEDLLKQRFLEQIQRQAQKQQAERDAVSAELGRGQLDIERGNLEQRVRENDAAAQPKAPSPIALGAGSRLIDPSSGKVLVDQVTPPETPQRPVSIAPGGRLVDPVSGKVIFAAPERPQAAQQDNGQFTSVQQVVGPDGKPAFAIIDRRTGTMKPVQNPAGFEPNRPARPVTGAERQTLNYFNRMLEAERNARKVEDKLSGTDIAASEYAPGWLENWLKSDAGQQYSQAQRTYTEARLRKESGAAIPQNEYDTDRKTNFRAAGDKPDALKQKRGSRLQTLRGIGNASGRALQEYYGENASLDELLKEFGDRQAVDPAAIKAAELIKKYGGG